MSARTPPVSGACGSSGWRTHFEKPLVNRCCSFFRSSVGKKLLVAITGLMLIGFVVVHMIGNLQFFAGPHVINEYGTKLKHLPFGGLWVLRIGLLGVALLHIFTTLMLVKENRAAKGQGYVKKASVQAKVATRLMALSGIILLSYIVFHLLHFTTHTISPQFAGWKNGEDHDVYRMIVAGFSNVGISIFYIVAMVLLAMHLSHGAASLFQTLGLRTKKMACCIGLCAQVFAWVICAGYVSIPVAVMAGFYDKKHIKDASEPSCCGTAAPATKEAK
jgi:succinate dehydrogenase / fumarate reductase cytochrome b subunit